MSTAITIKAYEIWSYGNGGEIEFVIVVSNDILNASKSETVIVVPIVTSDFQLPTHVRLEHSDLEACSNMETGFAACDLVRTVLKTSLKSRMTALSKKDIEGLREAIQFVFGVGY